MRHVFFIPASYTALMYGLIAAPGLLLCLYVGLVSHSKELLSNMCGPDHWEFWPSISSAIGDFHPERQIWRSAFVLCTPFRIGATITMFSIFWQKGCRGMLDVHSLLHAPRAFLSSSAFLTLLMFWADVWRLLGAIGWTMATSKESLPYHNVGFGPYVVYGFVLQITLTTLVGRNQFNLNIYESQRDAQVSLKLKKMLTLSQSLAALGILVFFTNHKLTCLPGSYSLSTMAEWVFAMSNVIYDATGWYEMKKEGWWISGSPEFYRALYSTASGGAVASGDVNAPPPALTRPTSPLLTGSAADAAARDTEKDSGSAHGGGGSSADPRSVADHDDGLTAAGGGGGGAVGVRVRDAPAPSAASYSAPLSISTGAGRGSALGDTSPSLPPSATGEYFLTHDVILHRFTFCSAPSRVLMWVCDIYWAYLLFDMLVNLVEHTYFMPLIAMSLSWEMGSLITLGSPCLLRIRPTRRWLTGPCPMARTLLRPSHLPAGMHYRVVPMYVMLYFLASFSHLHLLVQNNMRHKVLAVAFGPGVLLTATIARYLYPSTATQKNMSSENNEDYRRMLYAIPLGLVVVMLLRICHVGVSPMFVEPFYAGVFGIVLGVIFTTVIYRHAMFGNAVKESCAALGAGSGAADSAVAAGGGGAILRADDASKLGSPLLTTDGGAAKTVSDGDSVDAAEPEAAQERRRKVQFALGGDADDESAKNSIVALALAAPAPNHYLMSMLMGFIVTLSMVYYTSANYIPRMVAINPYPASLLVVAVFAAGLYYSVDVLSVCPQMMQPRTRLGATSRFLQATFRQSWRRFGLALTASLMLLLHATRQTNFSYENAHESYPVSYSTPKDDVLLKYWGVQANFWGNKYVAFAGGLGVTFCVGVLFPIVMELTLAHQRARRLALMAESVDPEQVYNREPSFFFSFEFVLFGWTVILNALYALVVSYPFVPMAWLVRERSRSLVTAHVLGLFVLTWILVRKGRHVKSTVFPHTAVARKQRTMQTFISILVVVAFGFVLVGRTVLQPGDVSYPAGKDTAVRYQDQVLRVHEKLIELRTARNAMTDPLMTPHQKTYVRESYEYAKNQLQRNITAGDDSQVDPQYGLQGLSQSVRRDIFDAASAMTFFSGMIWTVHFALDNNNVDSLARMVSQAQSTEAGIVGLLESDSMHVTNGNRDMVEYMSYYLGYRYTDYGSPVIDNTYGCAMISRYPILRVRRYVMPSPLGELACMVHAVLDVYGIRMHTYVAHFGNTHHYADGLLQSQFLGMVAQSNPGPSLWLGYLVSHPGDSSHYHQYTDPTEPGKFRDTALEMYVRRPWTRLRERGGFEEIPPPPRVFSPDEHLDFNVEFKLNGTTHLESAIGTPDRSFRRTPPGKALRHFYYNNTNRYSTAHPRFEFLDRYCQYNLYKTGALKDEKGASEKDLQPYVVELFDWWRRIDEVETLSDTEIQVTQLRFKRRQD